jgi:acetolactate synthase-1/2/3 large subunit
MIKYHFQKAISIARAERPGPVWIDLPLDLQWASIEPHSLASFSSLEEKRDLSPFNSIKEDVHKCFEFIAGAERPVILAGFGIRLAGAEKEFIQLIKTLGIPFLATWNVSDIIQTSNELYLGRPGIFGQRGANLAIQNCDLLICIGSHLSIPLTGTLFNAFAREAKKIVVDVDKIELQHLNVHVDLPIACDAKEFLQEMLRQAEINKCRDISLWLKRCAHYKCYNAVPRHWMNQKKDVNPYVFMDLLSDVLENDDIIVLDGGGTGAQITFQSFKVKEGQRLMIDTGLTAMGSGLPQSIGAYFGSGGRRIICLCGDGSLQLNIQELQTIVHHKLPIKIFVFNNGGYLAIRHTQDGFLQSNYVGSDVKGGLSLPDFQKVASAYGIKCVRINSHRQLQKKIQWTLRQSGPVLCEVMIARDQQVIPRQGFDKKADGTYAPRPLEDMYPYLERKEFLENMVIKPWG